MGRRIIVVDDHPLLAAGLGRELERAGALVELLEPHGGPQALVSTIGEARPDCAVLDLGLPFAGGGAALIGPLAAESVPVVVLTGETSRELLTRSAGEGARAVLSKSEPLPDIVETILRVADGETVQTSRRAELSAERQQLLAAEHERRAPFDELTPREQQILAGLMTGCSPAVLAEQNYVSVATVRTQVKSLLRKLGVGSQLEAVALANRRGWRPDDETDRGA